MKWRISKRRKKLGDYASRSPEQQTARNRKGIARRRAAAKKIIEPLLAQPCADCGKHYPPYIMEFDHVEGEKIDCVSQLAGIGWLKALRAEILKCEVVCANCHRARTYFRRLFRESLERFFGNDHCWTDRRRS